MDSSETRFVPPVRPTVSKTLLSSGVQGEPVSLPENVDELLLQQVRDATELVTESKVTMASAESEQPESKVGAGRQIMRTIMLDNEK